MKYNHISIAIGLHYILYIFHDLSSAPFLPGQIVEVSTACIIYVQVLKVICSFDIMQRSRLIQNIILQWNEKIEV